MAERKHWMHPYVGPAALMICVLLGWVDSTFRAKLEARRRSFNGVDAQKIEAQVTQLKYQFSSAAQEPVTRKDLLTVVEITALQLRIAALHEENNRPNEYPRGRDGFYFVFGIALLLFWSLALRLDDIKARLPESPSA